MHTVMFEENWGRILKGRGCGCQNTLCGYQNLPMINLLEFVKELIACLYDKRKNYFVKLVLSIQETIKSWKTKIKGLESSDPWRGSELY